MSDNASFQTYQPTPEATAKDPSEGVRVYDHQGAVQITLNGDETAYTTRGTNSYSTSDLAKDTHGESWKATARSPKGLPSATITADSVVKIDGVDGRVRDFVSAGRLREVSPGQFEMASQETPQENLQADQQDAAQMPEEIRADVDRAMQPLPEHARPALASLVANMAAGEASMEDVVSRFVAESGIHPEDARHRASFLIQAHQAQTDAFLMNRAGIPATELPQFYEAAKKEVRALQNAMNLQANGSMSGWRQIVAKYNSHTPPPLANVARAGLETRVEGGVQQVKIGSMWTSVQAAARAGFI